MKKIIILATAAMMAFATPALAGGKGLSIGLGVATGKGGVLGTVLGGHKRGGHNGINAIVDVRTGKGGILGALLGSRGKSHHGRRGGGHCGCR